MGEMKIILPDDIERAFRKAAMERFMYQKGAVSRAAGEAVKNWTRESSKQRENKNSNWDRFEGILKHVKKTSVELQHEAWDDIVKKHVHRR